MLGRVPDTLDHLGLRAAPASKCLIQALKPVGQTVTYSLGFHLRFPQQPYLLHPVVSSEPKAARARP